MITLAVHNHFIVRVDEGANWAKRKGGRFRFELAVVETGSE